MSSDNNVEKMFENANDYYYRNDYDKAKEFFEKILEQNDKHYQSLQKLAKIEIARGNLKEATEYYEKSLKINPKDSSLWNDLGNVYFDLSDFDKAIDSYKKAIEVNPKYYWAYYNVGLAMNEKWPDDEKKVEEAKSWYEKAIEIKKDYHPALNEIGLYYLNKKKYDKAKDYFDKCIKAYSSYKYPYYNLAKISKEQGNIEKAKEYLYKALQLDPHYTGAYNSMGIIFYDENDYMTALYYYGKAYDVDKNYKYAVYNMGLVFDRIEKYKKAYEAYKKALEIDSNYQPAVDEKNRLERENPDEIKNGEGLTEKDLLSETYKDMAKIFTMKDDVKKDKEEEKDNKKENTSTVENKSTEDLYIEKYGRNITRLAKEGKLFEVIGRDKEIREILEVLFKIKKNNPIIVGKAGVGKTAVVEGLAQKIVKGEVPEFFKNTQIIEINMGMLIAGTKYRGDFEVKLKRIISELKERNDIILFIDEIHTVIGAGETEDSSLDAANIFKPALARGELRCIGATTTEEYIKYFQKDAAFERRFYKINVDELDKDTTYSILKKLKTKMINHYKISIDDKLIKLIVDLSNEEIKNRVFPDKAIDILECCFSRCALDGKKAVDEMTVKNIIGEFVGIKFLETEEDKGKHLLEMEKYLKERVYGQDHAIDKISQIIRLTKQKLDLKPYQPDGIFFFAGPTGVGKTFLAKQIAKFLFGSEDKLFMLNMSEYTEPHSVSKLIGSPPGYVGYQEIAFFSNKILENPSSLLLLDEIEKAHPEVLKLFLQIFEEGKINDSKGRTIYFSNVTIIMTSNAIGITSSQVGFINQSVKSSVKLTDAFPPEFVNRIHEVIIFDYIEKDIAKNILKDLIIKKAIKMFEKKGIKLKFDSTFIDYILEKGYSRLFGVRNLERVFEKEVLTSVSNFLFNNPDTNKINITAESGRVQVQ